MGNGQSCDGFEGVLPSVSGDKVPGAANSEPPAISDAWTATSTDSSAAIDSNANKIGKIAPPGHALQQENNTERSEELFMITESVRKSRTLDAYADVCSEILPGFLYVSNLQVARDTNKLRALGITHVINCCGELKPFEDDVNFDVLKLSLRDDANEDLTPFLPQVVDYITNCRQNGKEEKVLVHCHQGVSRSCALAIAYVMLEQQLSYRDAAAIVKRQRAISSPNSAFICQLLEWEKELQAMRIREDNAGLSGLYRLTPHTKYDPECLVLKRCYESSAPQRQNMAIVRTPEDEQKLLWLHGTFVFQSPTSATDLIIWHGSKCEIPDAVARATELARQLLRIQTLTQHSDATMPMEIVTVQENSESHTGSDIDHFNYATELQWSRESVAKVPQFLLPSNGRTSNSTIKAIGIDQAAKVPKLFVLEDISDDLWDQLTNYDSEDLTADSAFLLVSVNPQGIVESYVWIGSSSKFTLDEVVQAAQKQTHSLSEGNSPPSLKIEHQNQESDAFWELFEAGY